MNLKRKRNKIGRWLSVLLACSFLVGSFPTIPAKAANRTLTVEVAKNMALAKSSDYTKQKNKLALAKLQYSQAVKAIKLKEKNQRTFRWSPLLNFKFPEKPDLTDQMEYSYKPLELQSEIDTINHSITDCVYGIYEEVELQFVEVYVLQERITFNENRIASCETSLEKNKARLMAGLANQTDIDTLEKKLETLNSTLLSDKRSFEAAKEKLGGLIGIDVSTSYTFQNPFVDADLSRNVEEELITYTLEHDDSYYQTQTATANGLLQLNTNYNLMKAQYGTANMRIIDSFVTQAKKGEKLDSAAFKLKFEQFLNVVDSPWQGKKKILFIRVPREWFKGAIHGIRYVEDEPYVLYESALEYQSLYNDEQAQKKELTDSVKSSYDNYVSTRNSSQALETEVKKKAEELRKAALLNTTGQMTYEEYEQVQEEYEELQMDSLDAKAAYSEVLYSLDRLTCGAVSSYFKGTSITMSAAEGGQSYVVEDEGEGVYYYIRSLVSDNLFEIGLSVPDSMDISLTDFELWVDGVQVGERTNVTKTIRHLALDVQEVNRVFIRLYDGDTFVDDCDIDTSEYSGKLTIKSYHVETTEDTRIGTYTASSNSVTGLLEITLKLNGEQQSVSYNIKTQDGTYLISDKKFSVGETFRYLAVAESSLEELVLCLYDDQGQLLTEAQFQTSDQTIHKKE